MPSYVTPKKNTEFIFYASVVDQANTKLMKSSPTIAAGDFKVSTDGGALGNLGTLPAVTPAASVMIKFVVSAAEMNGDNITIVGVDAVGAEWCDIVINIQTSARQVDDLAFPTTTGRSLDVAATGEAGVDLGNVTGTLGNTNVGWVDGSNRVDVGSWLGTAVTTSTASAKPEVDMFSISDDTTAANNAELDYDGTGYAKANSTIGTTTANTDMRGTDNAALASVLGALTDAAAAGDPTTTDTVMQYAKQLVNVLVGTTGVTTFPVEQAPANNINLAEVIRAIHADVTGLNGDVMRGTDSAALASVVGALTDAAAAGDPTTADTVMQYVKQLINILIGTAGIAAFPAESAPNNAVSLAEVIRAIHTDVTGLNGDVMRGTDSAALATVCTEPRLAELDAGNLPTDIANLNNISTSDVNTQVASVLKSSGLVLHSATIETVTDQTNFVILDTGDATDDDAYNGAVAVVIDGTDPNQVSRRYVTDYDATTRTVTINAAADFTVTNADTLCLLATGSTDGQVNAEVVDVLRTDTNTIPGQGTPTQTPTLEAAIMYLYKFMRNQIDNDGTTIQVYNDDAVTVDHKATVSEAAGLVTRGEFTTGP